LEILDDGPRLHLRDARVQQATDHSSPKRNE
jgi:hypothetical protein